MWFQHIITVAGRHPPPGRQTAPWEDTSGRQTPPPNPQGWSMQRTVRILLECILVFTQLLQYNKKFQDKIIHLIASMNSTLC